jgi:hypothetical protein
MHASEALCFWDFIETAVSAVGLANRCSYNFFGFQLMNLTYF